MLNIMMGFMEVDLQDMLNGVVLPSKGILYWPRLWGAGPENDHKA